MGRRYGQHFLRDPNWVQKIIASANLGPEDRVLEIGPGEGAMTYPMAELVKEVVAFEVDGELAHKLEHPRLTVKVEDILVANLPEALGGHKHKLIANLPYYITTPIMERVVPQPGLFSGMWLMMQHEVAKRIVSPATRESGALTYFVAQFWTPKYLFKVPPGAFFPVPAVDSAIVQFLPKENLPARPKRVERLTRMAFAQRRKTLRRSLDTLPFAMFAKAGIDDGRRPETLTLDEFLKLEEAWWNLENT